MLSDFLYSDSAVIVCLVPFLPMWYIISKEAMVETHPPGHDTLNSVSEDLALEIP